MSRDDRTDLESVFSVSGVLPAEALAQSLQALLPARRRAIPRRRFSVMDTADGRVRRMGGRLARMDGADGSVVWWRPPGSDGIAATLDAPARFAWDLPAGPLRRSLTPVIGVRRLFTQADAVAYGSILDVVDERRKTIARVRVESGEVRPPDTRAWRPLPTLVTVTALRGFEEAYTKLLPLVLSRPGVALCPGGFHGAVLRELGVPAWESLSAPRVDLPAAVRADVGARRIHRALLDVLLANEAGVKAHLDTEFLHDFRVAIRRTRSLLGQLKHVLPANQNAHFREEFSWLGALTGPARDLDVLMLALRDEWNAARATDADKTAVVSLFEARQALAQGDLREALEGERYHRLVDDWRAFLDQPSEPAADARDASCALAEVVSKRAWRLSRRIARSAGQVSDQTAPERLHAIRIDAKKLRYLIDGTLTLFDAESLEHILGPLKKLQNVLGDFNDAQAQRTRLLESRSSLAQAGGSPGALALIGWLADRRRIRQWDLRPEVATRLAHFAAKPVWSACRRTFRRVAVR